MAIKLWRSRPGAAPVVGLAWILIVGGWYAWERLALGLDRGGIVVPDHPDPFFRFPMAGIDRPATVAADVAALAPDEEVIGVVVAGRARAYRLDALRDRSMHLVNDVVGTLPVSVCYCDLGDCVRAYAGPAGPGPLDLRVAGLLDGRRLVLDHRGVLFMQDDGAAFGAGAGRPAVGPASAPVERTTWAEWRRRHPETDVYLGVEPGRPQ